MIKHFETLWEESEQVASEVFNSVDNIYFELSTELELLKKSTELKDEIAKSIHLGKIIFLTSGLSSHLKINIYPLLQHTINEYKIDLLESTED